MLIVPFDDRLRAIVQVSPSHRLQPFTIRLYRQITTNFNRCDMTLTHCSGVAWLHATLRLGESKHQTLCSIQEFILQIIQIMLLLLLLYILFVAVGPLFGNTFSSGGYTFTVPGLPPAAHAIAKSSFLFEHGKSKL